MPSIFSIDLTKKYVSQFRQQGMQALKLIPAFRNIDINRELSLSTLSWIYFNRDKFSLSTDQVSNLITRDIARSKFVVGSNIIFDSSLQRYPEKEALYSAARTIIGVVWKKLFAFEQIIKPRMCFPRQGVEHESASDPQVFGLIEYVMNSDDPVKWAEILAHELGHHYLTIVFATKSEATVNRYPWAKEDRSALRNMKRPLFGIYHAAFAEAAMLELGLRIHSNHSIEELIKQSSSRILDCYKNKYIKDLTTITKSGLLEFDKDIKLFMLGVRERIEV